MPPRRPDRRVQRTKQRLKEALLELIQKGEYDAITVQDITRLADVGRSTFYSHFSSKEELLFSGFDRWLLSLTDAAPARGGGPAPGPRSPARLHFSLPLLHHFQSQKRFFQATIGRGTNVQIRRKTTAMLAEVIRLEMERISPSNGRPTKEGAIAGVDPKLLREARVYGAIGAFLGLVSWWLSAGDRLSAETVDQVFQRWIAGELETVHAADPGRER
jgi:AcrR family transcriptional regulator